MVESQTLRTGLQTPSSKKSGDVVTLLVRLAANPNNLAKRSTIVSFKLTAQDNPALTITEEARFLGPR